MNWFTVEKINNRTFAISEYKHWERVHSYLLLGEKFALLIDSGLGIDNIKPVISKLTKLPIRVVTTHVHWDHIGGHNSFDYIYVHKDDANWLKNGIPIPLAIIKKDVTKGVKEFPINFDIDKYHLYTGNPSNVLQDNDIIDLGNRLIKVIHTPGHSPGHICLFDMNEGFLFSGDLIYEGTLYAFYPSTDPVLFKESIEKITKIKGIKKILPSHNKIDISNDMPKEILKAFKTIENSCGLKQGNGIFNFDDFSIHI